MTTLTPERQSLLDSKSHLLVFGGPGSGKTTMAILKAAHEIRRGSLKPRQHILFLSFARATVARVAQQAGMEISRSDRQLLEVNTYHGFAWNLLRSHGYLIRNGRTITLLPPPEAASRLAEIGRTERPAEKLRLFNEEGLLHFDLFANVTAGLLSKSKSLLRIVCDAYPLIVLDEFQDTNLDEWNLIKVLGNATRLIALADPEQRIYEFRGADPRRIGDFIQTYSPTQYDFGIENHRSNGTDIAHYGNDLLTGANTTKTYNNVVQVNYGFYHGRSTHFVMKTALIQGIKRQITAGDQGWAIAVLVPSKRLMLAVSDYLSTSTDGLPPIHHDVALDTEGPALAAALIAGLLEGEEDPAAVARQLLLDLNAHIRGRNGANAPSQADLKLATALLAYLDNGKIRGKNRQQLIYDGQQVASKRHGQIFSGDPAEDWLSARNFLAECTSESFRQVADDAKYLRLLHKGAMLRARLGELWRKNGSYRGAATAVRDALLQEHFSASTRDSRGVHVMTIHKSKGKEFNEVFIYEGTHQGRIVRPDASATEIAQSRLSLRVAVTRAKSRATIMTPKNNVCQFLRN